MERILFDNTNDKFGKHVAVKKRIPPHKFRKICRKEGVRGAKLPAQFSLSPHPHIFYVLRVDARVFWSNKVVLMDNNFMSISTTLKMLYIVVRRPSI